jgi:hypothetical protein
MGKIGPLLLKPGCGAMVCAKACGEISEAASNNVAQRMWVFLVMAPPMTVP